MKVILIALSLAAVTGCAGVSSTSWNDDFARQPIPERPSLEVRYTDASRTAFEVLGEAYHAIGELRAPHRLVSQPGGETWLTLEIEGADGTLYTSAKNPEASRINLYRRGPYYCEVHWFDIRVADESGNLAPIKGDVALYCYPDKMLASVAWHPTEPFAFTTMRVLGADEKEFTVDAQADPAAKSFFAWPVFGETEPLPPSALETLSAVGPLRYDAVRGCYMIGSDTGGGFQGHFYDTPNGYETVQFRIRNDAQPRKIYICHETLAGPGIVEGGVVLDPDGHPMPIVVQVSKNFAGEKEERFYNPTDIPFSETFFPLYLEPNEERTLSSHHVYQNWGRHMTKHFSSLGAWMDYFHSSTGVTETTCYVPFKFGGLPGVSIADFRAMSQSSFWGGQPQHDNVAGHTFLSYFDGDDWQHSMYSGTHYYSTGPNWYDIGLDYLSADGKVKVTVRTFEMPQKDELRNFIRVRYEVLEPLIIEDPRANFRLLQMATWVQGIRYTHFGASGYPDAPLDFGKAPFPVKGVPLPAEDAYLALYGDGRGANGIVVSSYSAPGGIGLAASVQAGRYKGIWKSKKQDTRLLLVPDADRLELEPGDVFEIDAFWMPYGEVGSTEPVQREAIDFGSAGPRIESVQVGTKVADFPTEVRADMDRAEFTMRGGRDLVPVIVSGLSKWTRPRLQRRESNGWTDLSHARVGDLDGIQVASAADGTFSAIFLVASDDTPQELRFAFPNLKKVPQAPAPRISVVPLKDKSSQPDFHVALIQAPWMEAPIQLRSPEVLRTDAVEFVDHKAEGLTPRQDASGYAGKWKTDADTKAIWFDWQLEKHRAGGRITPNEDDVDLEFWVGNGMSEEIPVNTQFCTILKGTMFEDRSLERTWIHSEGEWKRMADTHRGGGDDELCHYPLKDGPKAVMPMPWGTSTDFADAPVVAITSPDGQYVFAIAWPNPGTLASNTNIPCVHADPMWPRCPPGRRVHTRGKMYLLRGTLDDVLARVRREILR